MVPQNAAEAYGRHLDSDRIARMRTPNLNKKLTLVLAASVALAAGCATNPGDPDPDPDVFAAEVDRRLDSDPNKRRCKTIRATGTRVSERVCRTNAEWAKIEEESKAAISAIQRDQQALQGETGN